MVDTPPLLEVRRISKRFSGVRALHDVSLTLQCGEVLAVVGENGAGKSTLMRIVAGVEAPDDGQLFLDGREVQFKSVAQALHAGIALIHQELNLADKLSIAANLFLGREPHRLGLINQQAIDTQSRQHLEMVGLDISPQTIVAALSIGQQQLVEIAKALSTRARLIIMDEPTSALSEHESQTLFQVVHQLRARGVSVLYISHRLHEVELLADRVIVLRDGQLSGQLHRPENRRHNMLRLMIGRDVSRFYHRTPHTPGDEVLSVQGLRTRTFPQHPLGFSLRAGEVVGLAGLVGAGRSELLTTLYGVAPAVAGSMICGRLRRPPRSARQAIAAAVLGGCSLRGGEGSISGVVIGAAVMVVLSNAINLAHPDYQNIEFAIIGGVILLGVIVDELTRRLITSQRESARHASQ